LAFARQLAALGEAGLLRAEIIANIGLHTLQVSFALVEVVVMLLEGLAKLFDGPGLLANQNNGGEQRAYSPKGTSCIAHSKG
jgi:hypothetical protein